MSLVSNLGCVNCHLLCGDWREWNERLHTTLHEVQRELELRSVRIGSARGPVQWIDQITYQRTSGYTASHGR